MIKLIGILLVAIGFGFRLNALAVVLMAGLATGVAAGFSLREVVEMTGKFFVDNRGLTLPIVLMLPVVGLLEKHGLQERVAAMMRKIKAATVGKIYWVYQALRGGLSVLGISLGSHAGMVRPLIVPMAEGAAKERGELNDATREKIRAHGAASENVGNFFSDDILVAVGALLLVKSVFDAKGIPVTLEKIKLWSAPTAVWVLFVGWWRYRALDRSLKKGGGK
ncbi:DUF969 domain-containing protein [Oleiharenicola lentus]|uniref:DUF969 domain-containing protein n=1 Tax=Oleiharenicola lentus TaxID=2508720 RepID=UPI003F66E6A4